MSRSEKTRGFVSDEPRGACSGSASAAHGASLDGGTRDRRREPVSSVECRACRTRRRSHCSGCGARTFLGKRQLGRGAQRRGVVGFDHARPPSWRLDLSWQRAFHELGQAGVLLFFVHTSVVLMMSLERQQRSHFRMPYLVFVLRRAFRLLPLSMLVVAVVCVFRLPVAEFKDSHLVGGIFDTRTVLTNLLLVQNVTLDDSVLTTLWTLPYEIQMYLVLPLLFLIAQRSRGLIPLLCAWGVSALAFELLKGNPHSNVIMFAPCFVAGVICYQLLRQRRGKLPFVLFAPALMLAVAGLQLRPGFHGWWAFCLGIAVLLSQFRELGPGLLRESCRVIARYSYGIYLSHVLCMWLGFVVLAAEPSVVRWLAFALSACLAPVLLYHAVEAPMIALGSRLVRHWAVRAEPAPAAIYDKRPVS